MRFFDIFCHPSPPKKKKSLSKRVKKNKAVSKRKNKKRKIQTRRDRKSS